MKTMNQGLTIISRCGDQSDNKVMLKELVWKDLWEHIFSGFAWLA